MFEQLKPLLEKYKYLESSMVNPVVTADPVQSAKVYKEYNEMMPLMTAYITYLDCEKAIEDAELLCEENDPELHTLAVEELKTAKEKRDVLQKEITKLLIPKDPDDDKNAIVEIRAGAGGEEAALFVADLYRMYSMFMNDSGLRFSMISSTPTELGGYRQLAFLVEGAGAFGRFRFESGVHRVQRVPLTESQGRIQTSTVTVAVLPEMEEVKVEINPADIVFESCKSSGAGGQHINKTESAVRLTHKPTGIVVECQQERSQFKNKDKAMQMLQSILFDRMQTEQNDKIAGERRSQVGTGDRSEKIRTYNYPQDRITDHRIGLSLHGLDKFMNGDIGDMIDALANAYMAEKMKQNEVTL